MQARIEEGRVLSRDDATLLLGRQSSVVQVLLVRDIDTESVQVVDIVRVGGDLV